MTNYDVKFFPIIQGIVFQYNNHLYEASKQNLMKLKNELAIPYILYFIGCSRAEVCRIITGLGYENDSVLFLIKKIKNKEKGPISFIVECHKNKDITNESEFYPGDDFYGQEKKYMKSRRNGSRIF